MEVNRVIIINDVIKQSTIIHPLLQGH